MTWKVAAVTTVSRATGYLPDHTLENYALGIALGADHQSIGLPLEDRLLGVLQHAGWNQRSALSLDESSASTPSTATPLGLRQRDIDGSGANQRHRL